MISRGLALAASSLLDREADLQSAGRHLSEELYQIVADEPDRKTRTQLIALRRVLYGSVQPVPSKLLDSAFVSYALTADTRSSLVQHAAERWEFVKKREHFDQLYRDAAVRERAELFSLTSDEAFRKALYIASPGTLAALARLPHATRKQRRRLEETLHSYLMRAIGRATPNGAWSAVTFEGSRDGHSRVVFAARLDPFAAALKAISDRDPWRSQLPLRVNPTLRQRTACQFEYFHKGAWNSYQSPDHHLTVQLTELLGKTHVFPNDIYAVRHLVDSSILLRTLELPRIFSDSWSAIDEIIPRLPASEQEAWRESLRNLLNLSEQLGLEYDTLPLETLQSGMDSARCIVNALLARYGVTPVPEDRHVLLADRRAALSSALPSDLKARLGRAIRSYWSFDRYGMGEKKASSERRFVFGQLPQTGMSFEELASRNTTKIVYPGGTDYLHRWHSELSPVVGTHRHALSRCECPSPVPPGSGLVRIDAAGHLRVGSITPDPCLFYSRFNALFRTGAKADPFCEWYRAGIKDTESAFPELSFTDVSFSSTAHMNSAARTNMTGRVLDLSHEVLGTLRFYSDSTDWPKLRAGQAGRAIVPRLHSAALPDESDAHACAIQQFSFLIGRPSLLRPLPHFKEESESWHHLPRLTLDDFVVSPERWTPGEELVETLRSSSSSMRYLAWRKYARGVSLPNLVYISSGGADSELLFHSESVLAIDLLGRRLEKHGGPLLIQEAWPSPRNSWLQDARGFHYAAELALAWHGDQAFWSAYLGCTRP